MFSQSITAIKEVISVLFPLSLRRRVVATEGSPVVNPRIDDIICKTLAANSMVLMDKDRRAIRKINIVVLCVFAVPRERGDQRTS